MDVGGLDCQAKDLWGALEDFGLVWVAQGRER